MSALDAVGFPTRGLSPDDLAGRLADWVRWPIERGGARDVERAGRRLRVHELPLGGGAHLVTVVEIRKRYFLPGEEIVCFFPSHAGTEIRALEIFGVDTPSCPLEPFATVAFPERIRFRVGNPFEATPEPGRNYPGALTLLASRVEAAPEGTRPMVLAASLAHHDPELPAELHAVAGRIEERGGFVNAATGEPVMRWIVSTPGGRLTVLARAQGVAAAPEVGEMAVAEGEFVGTLGGAGA